MNLLTPAQLLNGLPSPKAGENAKPVKKKKKKKKNISLKELREQRAQQNGEAGKNVDGGKKASVLSHPRIR